MSQSGFQQDAFTEQTFEFESRSGSSRGHTVSLKRAERGANAGKLYLTCTCPGGRFAFAGDPNGRGCWAMQKVREALNIPAL